jgi:hypothetical protein
MLWQAGKKRKTNSIESHAECVRCRRSFSANLSRKVSAVSRHAIYFFMGFMFAGIGGPALYAHIKQQQQRYSR